MKKQLFLFILMLLPMLASAEAKDGNLVSNNADQMESLYGEWWLVGWSDEGNWFVVDPSYVSHRKLSIEIPREGSVMAYSMANEIFLGLLTLNGNEMIFGGEMQRWMTQVYYDLMENLFFEDHICDIKSYQLEGNLLKLYYTDNDYFVFTSDLDSLKEIKVDYIPFVESGKQWYVVSAGTSPYSVCHLERYEMFENVERDGKIYAHTLCIDDELCEEREAGLFREENRRVYKYDETAGRDIMLYDFSLKEGDTFTYEHISGSPETCKVLKLGWLEDGPQIISSTLTPADTLVIKSRKLRTWTIGRDNGLGEYHEIATWVECIGLLENMFCPFGTGYIDCLAYILRKEHPGDNEYLPFSFYNIHDVMGHVHGCNLPTGEEDDWEGDSHHKLTYELEGDSLHVYGKAFTQCGPNNYAYFYERKTDDPLVNKIEFIIQEVEPLADCVALHTTDFYVPGFDPNMNYIVVEDNTGEEHPVINKTPKMAYRPMIEEGKVWKVGTIPTDLDTPVQIVDHYYFDGDTIIDGKICKQMMCQHYTSPNYPYYENLSQPNYLRYVGAWYEENKKVYFYDERTQSMVIKYDFSLEANDTLQFLNVDGYPPFTIGPKQTGGIEGFKGIYRDVMMGQNVRNTTWLEGIGGLDAPFRNAYDPRADRVPEFLMSCTVGDEVIYLNDRYADGASPAGVRKDHFDFTHTPKIKPKTRVRSEEEPSLYGEYNDQQLDIDLGPLDDTYQVYITNESGKAVYEKAVNAGNIVGLNIDISSYAKGRYTVTVENSSESFIGEFETLTTGIQELKNSRIEGLKSIYNLQGQRLSRLQKGLNIVNGRKIYVKD